MIEMTLEPWGARLLAMDEVETFLTTMIRVGDRATEMSQGFDLSLAEKLKDAAARFREIHRQVHPTDQVWLLTEPPDHPEFIQGSAYLVVIRGGKLVVKHKLVAA